MLKNCRLLMYGPMEQATHRNSSAVKKQGKIIHEQRIATKKIILQYQLLGNRIRNVAVKPKSLQIIKRMLYPFNTWTILPDPKQKCSERGNTKFLAFFQREYIYHLRFFFIEAFATKSWEKSRIFGYGMPKVFFSKGKKP